jgi:hypothetical protein
MAPDGGAINFFDKFFWDRFITFLLAFGHSMLLGRWLPIFFCTMKCVGGTNGRPRRVYRNNLFALLRSLYISYVCVLLSIRVIYWCSYFLLRGSLPTYSYTGPFQEPFSRRWNSLNGHGETVSRSQMIGLLISTNGLAFIIENLISHTVNVSLLKCWWITIWKELQSNITIIFKLSKFFI